MTVPDKVRDLVRKSGNAFHARVARAFSDAQWHVVVSPYYMDQTQQKAREIDLVAERSWQINSLRGYVGELVVRLFVECKYISFDSVFWFADKNIEAAKSLVYETKPFRKDNIRSDEHHYIKGSPRVAKLFTSSKGQANENEPIYKALNQTLNAMVAMRGKPVLVPDMKARKLSAKYLLEYPVIVCNSFERMYSTDFLNESDPRPVRDNFELEVQYAYHTRRGNQRDDYFLVDVVELPQLDDFLAFIKSDADNAGCLGA